MMRMAVIGTPQARDRRTARTAARGTPPVERGRRALEAWFADAGLAVEVVGGCPVPGCDRCGPHLPAAA